MKKRIIILSIIIITLTISLSKKRMTWAGEVREVTIESLYKTKVIDNLKLFSDDAYYLKSDPAKEEILYFKRGKDNQPFSLDIAAFKVKAISQGEWEEIRNKPINQFYESGDFIIDKGRLLNIYTKELFKPKGKYIVKYCVSPSGKLVFIYSFSGYYRAPEGIGFWSSSSKGIGINFFEIWDIDKQEESFSYKHISFSHKYFPDLLFWLEHKRLIIFSNNYNRSLIIVKY